MTKKDYIKLADALLSAQNSASNEHEASGVRLAASYVADALANDNPRFDAARFEAECKGKVAS